MLVSVTARAALTLRSAPPVPVLFAAPVRPPPDAAGGAAAAHSANSSERLAEVAEEITAELDKALVHHEVID